MDHWRPLNRAIRPRPEAEILRFAQNDDKGLGRQKAVRVTNSTRVRERAQSGGSLAGLTSVLSIAFTAS